MANGKILNSGLFDDIYIYPAAGDDGISIGAALNAFYKRTGSKPIYFKENKSPYLGYSSDDKEIVEELEKHRLKYKKVKNIAKEVATLLTENKFVGWYQGRAEIGPRALGNRSIVVNPTIAGNKDEVNAKIKFREQFRPFAPSALFEKSKEWFDTKGNESPYMILAFGVKSDKIKTIPAVTHVDGTARLQTVKKSENSKYWYLINEFYRLTKVPVILNTSFNVKDQPIVNTPKDAIECFLNCGLDVLAIGDFLVVKENSR